MEYGVVLEGGTRLKVPSAGGITSREEVFYNPHMRLNRDITVVLCRQQKAETFLDVMAGSGARGVRCAKEAGVRATLNDLNPKAVALIRENAALNGVDAEVASQDARQLMSMRRFDYVDLDPFGPPVAYADSAVSAVRLGGVLGVCATDTSALCGTYPGACMRKYDATPLKADCYGEIGLRILLGFIARAALRHERGIDPLFCHTTRHYMRVQVRVDGRHALAQEKVGFLQYCPACMRRGYAQLGDLERTCACGGRLRTAGPLWTGRFADDGVCAGLAGGLLEGEFQGRQESVKLVETVRDEQAISTPHYDLHKICKMLGIPAKGMDEAREIVSSGGRMFSRTHFNPTGFRTDMPLESLASALKG
jgi:tRNA (guanine26-N2/guanine27-N2)-dimethyltransferase